MGCAASAPVHEERPQEAAQDGDETPAPARRGSRNLLWCLTGSSGDTASRSGAQEEDVDGAELVLNGETVTAEEPSGVPNAQDLKLAKPQTVRSLINLKKHTLKVLPDPDKDGAYLVSFVADSSAPCKASIYMMAYEKPVPGLWPRLKSRYTKGDASITERLSGMDQHYVTPSGKGLPFGSYTQEELKERTEAGRKIFPLVVRLEVQLNPSKKDDLQVQTTYATITKLSDGAMEVSVVRQVLWVSGYSYVLYEIFGVDRPTEEVDVATPESDGKDCVICLAEPRDTLALPCRHLCLCSDCAKALRFRSNKCPICRGVVRSLLQIKTSEQQQTAVDTLDTTAVPEETQQISRTGADEKNFSEYSALSSHAVAE